MKNLYQLIPNVEQRNAAIIDLKFAKKLLKRLSDGDETVDPTFVVYIGFLVFGLVELSKAQKDLSYTNEHISVISESYHTRALDFSGKRKQLESLPINQQKIEREKIDLKFAQHLLGLWVKNKIVNANDALYVGYLVHSIFFQKTNVSAEKFSTPERIEHLAVYFHEYAMKERFAKS